MIKATISNGIVDAELEGTKSEILTDLTAFTISVFEQLEKATGIPKEFHKCAFLIGLKLGEK